MKQIPVGYFRTYTYQPLGFNPQTPNHYFSYQAASTVKTFPPAAAPPQKTVVQQFGVSGSTAPSPLTFNSAASHITNKLGAATTNVQPSIQQPPEMQQQYQPAEQQPSLPTPVTSNINQPINAELLSNSHHEDLQQLPPSTTQHHQFRQYQLPEQHLNLQYYAANVAPLPMQQIQFVPCMCPVSLTLPTEMTANKRIDDQPMMGNIGTGIDAKDGVETFEEK